jgi:integrase
MTDKKDTTGDTKSEKKPRTEHISPDGKWRSFPQVSNLLQYVSTGMYYGRLKVEGKLVRQKLNTNSFTTAKLKLADFLKKHLTPVPEVGTLGVGIRQYLRAIRDRHDIADSTRKYYRDCVRVLMASWPNLRRTRADRIKVEQCRTWAKHLSEQKDANYFNNVLSAFKNILLFSGVASEANPLKSIKRLGSHDEPPALPERDQFQTILHHMETSGAGQAQHCADLARFLAFSGQRVGVARNITWVDVHLNEQTKEGYIAFRKKKSRKGQSIILTNNVPIIPDMAELLIRLRKANPAPQDRVVKVFECQKSLDRASKLAGAARITHHDLRHLFASAVIEGGVDIPTLSRWLGHSDGGALAMKVYGHLRHAHSAAMAQKVTFKTKTQAPAPTACEATYEI